MTIKAITFDFWDTLACDDSDEPKRAALGLKSKSELRFELISSWIAELRPDAETSMIRRALDDTNHWYIQCWNYDHYTPSALERLEHLARSLNLGHARHKTALARLAAKFESFEVEVPPDPAPHSITILKEISAKFQLGIISDTIYTPGSGIRKILERYGVLDLFKILVFSDEAGASKPAPLVYDLACKGLNLQPDQVIHIGDREKNDITGPRRFGMHSILYTGVRNEGAGRTEARKICRDFRELPRLLSSIS